MYFWIIIGILVITSMESLAMQQDTPSGASTSAAAPRNYTKIGMLCSCNKRNENDTLFMEIGERDSITSALQKFGKDKKVIFFINGYGENMNPEFEKRSDSSFEYFQRFTYSFINQSDQSETIACAFDYNLKENMNPVCLIGCYLNIVKNRVPFAAKMVKKVAAEMFENHVFNTFKDFELIGFSMGAHIAGLAARLIKSEMEKDVLRIFALDPARRIRKKIAKQLQKSDAKYIQAIITSSLGQSDLDVHCKIFFNDGAIQPGCEKKVAGSRQCCSHIYALTFYTRIIRKELELTAYKLPEANEGILNVPDQIFVGHYADSNQDNASGVFFANTNTLSKVKNPKLKWTKK